MLQLVCIDVDGTLIGESGEPTNGVLDAIMHARSLGQTLALSTAVALWVQLPITPHC